MTTFELEALLHGLSQGDLVVLREGRGEVRRGSRPGMDRAALHAASDHLWRRVGVFGGRHRAAFVYRSCISKEHPRGRRTSTGRVGSITREVRILLRWLSRLTVLSPGRNSGRAVAVGAGELNSREARMVRSERYISPDGTPEYVIHTEQLLVGGGMLAPLDAIPSAARPEDFHDDTLGTIWNAVTHIAATRQEPSVPAVARLLEEWGSLEEVGGEPRLVLLAGDRFAFLYAGKAALEAHAGIVAEWGAKRREIARLADEIRSVTSGKVIPSAHRFRGGVSFDYVEAADAQ